MQLTMKILVGVVFLTKNVQPYYSSKLIIYLPGFMCLNNVYTIITQLVMKVYTLNMGKWGHK